MQTKNLEKRKLKINLAYLINVRYFIFQHNCLSVTDFLPLPILQLIPASNLIFTCAVQLLFPFFIPSSSVPALFPLHFPQKQNSDMEKKAIKQ